MVGGEDMGFPGVKEIACGISRGDQEKNMRNFQRFWFLALEIPRDVIQFCVISRGGAFFCLELQGIK